MSYTLDAAIASTEHYKCIPALDACAKLIEACLQGSINREDYLKAFGEAAKVSKVAAIAPADFPPIYVGLCESILRLHSHVDPERPSNRTKNAILALMHAHHAAALALFERV